MEEATRQTSAASPRQDRVRNFCIIAHIDHGKSTLADRLLQITGAVSERDMREQVLDTMDLERERGITIKASAVRLHYTARDGHPYTLNLIDTPGHVDFAYEVSRSLAACEGALLVVDAAQGVEAQTVANFMMALEHDLTVIPVINKIDLASARVEEARAALYEELALDPDDALLVSAKEGVGIGELLEAIVARIPAPSGSVGEPLRCLLFDSIFDIHRGVVGFVRVMSGTVRRGGSILMMASGTSYRVEEVGIFAPAMQACEELRTGDVGYIISGVKTLSDMRVGDTITDAHHPAPGPLPGYKVAKPMVFCGLYPVDNSEHDGLRDALERLQLNDAALSFEKETSEALGFGFRAGFLGLLHMEIVQERLEREYGLNLIATSPNVVYKVHLTDGTTTEVDNPADFPGQERIDSVEEPFVLARVFVPDEFVGPCMDLCGQRRGVYVDMRYGVGQRVTLTYELPLAEILVDFFDQLKSRSRGYASLDYEPSGTRVSSVVRLDIWLNGEPVDALSTIIHRDRAYERARSIVDRLKELLPRQQFRIHIQGAIAHRVIAAAAVRAFRKDVTAKCYGGDITRKRKLLERQKEGKKRMKMVGQVEIPQSAFMALLRVDE